MPTKPPPMKSKFNLASIIRIHKIIGVCLALWLLVMVFTGILLNHSRDLNLDKKPIRSSFLLGIYGIKAPDSGQTFIINRDISLHLIEKNLFWNKQKIQNLFLVEGSFLTAANTEEVLVYAPGKLALFTLKGELIEIKKDSPIINALKIGVDQENNFYLKTSKEIFKCNSDFEIQIIPSEPQNIKWAISQPTDSLILKELHKQNEYKEINYERLLIDIHNGNIFGSLNKFLLDFLSIFFILLIFTGLYIWFRKLRPKSQ